MKRIFAIVVLAVGFQVLVQDLVVNIAEARTIRVYMHSQDERVPSCKYRFRDDSNQYRPSRFTPREVVWTIKCAVRRWSVYGGLRQALCVANRESHFGQWADNPYSTASGVYQFVQGTWMSRKSNLHSIFVNQRMSWSVWNARSNVMAAIKSAHGGGWGPWGGWCYG